MSFKYKVFSVERAATPTVIDLPDGRKLKGILDQIAVQLVPEEAGRGGTVAVRFDVGDERTPALEVGDIVNIDFVKEE